MTPIIEAQGLAVSFRAPGGFLGLGHRRLAILEDISVAIHPSETLGLVGESGSGKTTLARALLGLVPRSRGSIRFEGKPIEPVGTHGFRHLRRKTAMMFQDPVASLSPRLAIGSAITEPFVIHGAEMSSRRAAAEELLTLVGLPKEFISRYPHELSGGQARRAGVARALALRPSLVIADEPTAGLDVSIQGEILNLMTRLKAELDLSYIIVTHNLAMIRHVSERIAIMYLGRIVEEGPTTEIFAKARHPYTASLIASEPIPDPRRKRRHLAITGEVPSILMRPSGCEFHTRCPFAKERCRAEAPPLTPLTADHKVRCHYPIN
ncbi:ABC transporter ATP-binding protein [Nordella sp. HKS 07]|uniref:oligopeptide/dipeptide ABC transporter ATP-binding protein n=1 Tax=Nordella sp. HKS 07 TaxID=2712222 RepID=UPI0013E1A7D7|nr:ABC transporter ATP-binding protein [Nordella sp. HKS 07]QIG47243.1 ABC transporter ATP-binding protein [Nordella sp. HKS 07]